MELPGATYRYVFKYISIIIKKNNKEEEVVVPSLL